MAQNKRSDKTKRALADSVMHLLIKKPLDKITIEEIVSQADLTRQAFYNHFEDKYALIDWIYRTQAVDFISLLGDGYCWIDAVIAKLNIIKNNPDFYKKVYRQEWFIASFTDITYRLYVSAIEKNAPEGLTEENKFIIDFYVTACVKKTSDWVNSNCKEDAEKMAIEFLGCIPEKIKRYLLTESDLQRMKEIEAKNA